MSKRIRIAATATVLILTLGLFVGERARGASITAPTPAPPGHAGNPPGKPDTSGLAPTPVRVDDLAIQTPTAYKATVVVQHSDGTVEWYLVASDQTGNFVRKLPASDRVLVVVPPQVLMGHYAVITPSPGTLTYPSSRPASTPPSTPTPQDARPG